LNTTLLGFHNSKNRYKKLNENEFYQLTTYRCKDSYENFKNDLDQFLAHFESMGFIPDKVESEACIVDTNEDLDRKWIYG
jgi:hypothetical protein